MSGRTHVSCIFLFLPVWDNPDLLTLDKPAWKIKSGKTANMFLLKLMSFRDCLSWWQASRVRSYISHQGSGVSNMPPHTLGLLRSLFESVIFVRILKRTGFTSMFQIFPNNLLYKRYISDRFKTFFDQSIAKELVNIQSKYCFFEPQEK